MALRDSGEVTRVGVDNIQFYIPRALSTDERCPFEPEDEFEVRVLPHTGLLLTPDEAVLEDLLDDLGIDVEQPLPDHD